MNVQIRRSAAVLLAGFLVLAAGAGYRQVYDAERLAARDGNPRIVELGQRDNRGTIFSADGAVLAASRLGADGRRERVYSTASLAHAIGYLSITYGVSGLEESFNGDLTGSRAGGTLKRAWHDVTREPLTGNDLVLTIDTRVQRAAAEALGNRPGAVVALNPRTGALLAMVSAPAFDPNTVEEKGAALIADPAAPLINRVTQGQYAPGSVFKTVTAVAGLEANEFRPESTFRCLNGLVVQGFVIACRGVPQGVREYDFAHAYAWSINVNFAEIGQKVGSQRFVAQARRFGFEERIPFDLPVTPSRLLRPGSSFSDVLLATTAFGQGELSATPLQMALVAAAVGSDGTVKEPYLVAEVREPQGGAVLRRHEPKPWRRVMRPETAAALRGFMVTAVRDGFSGGAAIPGVQVGGKTGTAESAPEEEPHAWFTGIAPAENPSVVVAVVVENAGQGAAVAAPIAGAVMRAALQAK